MKLKVVLFYLQRTIKSFKLRKMITDFVAKRIGKKEFDDNKFFDLTYNPNMLKALHANGFYEFENRLDDETVDKIINSVDGFKLIDPYNSSYGQFDFDQIPESTHVANYSRDDLSTVPLVQEIANDKEVLKLVQEFLGAAPTISNINMWWSLIGKSQAKDAQLFHRDVDDLKFCKLFIYLTDVGTNDGPHTYVKHSSSIDKFTKIRRYSDEEIHEAFDEKNVVNFVRPKGSVFIVDTYGFHKGTLPIDNNRLILQVQYSLLPIFIENYTPHKDIKARFNSYTNRLLYA